MVTIEELDSQKTIVLDLTYVCNSSCSYCRWGNPNTENRSNLSFNSLIIPAETLKNLQTKRLVLSGGEPRLYPRVNDVLDYYKGLVENIVLITNGYGLNIHSILDLVERGVTGFTFSIDSLIPEEEYATRKTTSLMFQRILQTLIEVSSLNIEIELGINSVVTHVNANWRSVSNLLSMANRLTLDFVKFNPVFDDGYAGTHAPKLLLTSLDSSNLREIAYKIEGSAFKNTNGKEFWLGLAELTSGKKLKGSRCGLGSHKANSINGTLTMCYWLEAAKYGNAASHLDLSALEKVQKTFDSWKDECTVDFQCFCNQRIGHSWI